MPRKRYAPAYTRFRQLVMDGTVGRPLAVDFSWILDTSHGADYFRRWHREKQNSGGLLVHKATHHFDLVNWWIDSYPQQVFAMGDLMFYDEKDVIRGLYLAAEDETGYIRDRNVFGAPITIEDTMRVTATPPCCPTA